MGKEATPGTVLCLGATIILALVSFNTPLIKSLNFLTATYGSGSGSATATFGTLGYCYNGVCTGPKLGYEFDPNAIFGVTGISIPSVITKYLTYLLVLHIVALGLAAAATVFGALSHIRGLALLCFPTCFAYMASAVSLIALVFDLVIWYIAKVRIDAVSGASASIGACVWMTLAAWLLLGLTGCAYGCGTCCLSKNRRGQEENRRNRDAYQGVPGNNDYSMNGKRVGPPVREQEVSVPLTAHMDDENKYLDDDALIARAYGTPSQISSTGQGVPGVGVGYGPRDPAPSSGPGLNPYSYPQQAQYGDPTGRSGSPYTPAGSFVGVGAGPGGAYAPGMGGAAPGAPGYVPGGQRPMSGAGMGMGMAGMGAMGAGAAMVGNGYGGYTGQPQGQDQYNNYPPQHQRQLSNDNYNPTYPPPASQAGAAMPNPHQPRSPTGYNPYSNSAPMPQPAAGYNTDRYSTTSSGDGGNNWNNGGGDRHSAYGGYEANSITPIAVPQPQHIGGTVSRGPDFPLNAPTPSPSVYSSVGGQQQQQMGYQGNLGTHQEDDGDFRGPRPPSYDSAAAGGTGGGGGGGYGGQMYGNANEKSGRL